MEKRKTTPTTRRTAIPYSEGYFIDYAEIMSKFRFIQFDPSKVLVTYQAVVAIRLRSPIILAAVEALQQRLRFDGARIKPLGSLHITLARVTLTVEKLER